MFMDRNYVNLAANASVDLYAWFKSSVCHTLFAMRGLCGLEYGGSNGLMIVQFIIMVGVVLNFFETNVIVMQEVQN